MTESLQAQVNTR